MKTVKKLGKKFKQKYPQYSHLSDEEAGRLVKQQYPGEYDDYVEESLIARPSQAFYPRHSPQVIDVHPVRATDLEQSIEMIRRGEFRTGWKFFNRIRTTRAIAKADLLAAQSAIADQMIELEVRIQRARAAQRQTDMVLYEMQLLEEMREAQHKLEKLKNKIERKLSQEAYKKGLRLDDYGRIKVLEAEKNIRLNEEQEMSRLKVEEQREMERIRLEAWLQEKNVQVKSALIKRLIPHYEVKVLTDDVFKLLDLAYEIQTGHDPQKERKLAIIEQQIAELQEAINERQGSLKGNRR